MWAGGRDLEFKLNLLENSIDYFENSLELFEIADEGSIHEDTHSSIENKRKWKLAFITLIQSIELLLKEALFRENRNLIYDDLDSINIQRSKTINITTALNRILNLTNYKIDKDKYDFILKCVRIRNIFMHNIVEISSIDIKKKYCTLFLIYLELHKLFLHCEYDTNDKVKNSSILHIKWFITNKITLFRGTEINSSEIEDIKKEIEENSEFHHYLTMDNLIVNRIPFGQENKILETDSELWKRKYCDDCGAIQGEYHLYLCDLEICPVCKRQLISCNCIKNVID